MERSGGNYGEKENITSWLDAIESTKRRYELAIFEGGVNENAAKKLIYTLLVRELLKKSDGGEPLEESDYLIFEAGVNFLVDIGSLYSTDVTAVDIGNDLSPPTDAEVRAIEEKWSSLGQPLNVAEIKEIASNDKIIKSLLKKIADDPKLGYDTQNLYDMRTIEDLLKNTQIATLTLFVLGAIRNNREIIARKKTSTKTLSLYKEAVLKGRKEVEQKLKPKKGALIDRLEKTLIGRGGK